MPCPLGVRCTLPGARDEETGGPARPDCDQERARYCNEDRGLFLQQLAAGIRRLYGIHKERHKEGCE